MTKVIGIGGLFFKSADPDAVKAWYGTVLGMPFEPWGMVFTPRPPQRIPGRRRSFRLSRRTLTISRLRIRNLCST